MRSLNTMGPMATLTIRNLSQSLKERLRVRAAQRGHSMEAEARDILKVALGEAQRPPQRNLCERVHARFAALGGIDRTATTRARPRATEIC
jgi:plasmid stability protein